LLKPLILINATCLALATAATAQQAIPCDWVARADTIVEPWEQNTRLFANGDVRLALLDTIEPAAGGLHILILSPPYSEMGDRQCMTLGMTEGVGFSDVDFNSLEAGYDPSVGLIFDMDVRFFNGNDFHPGRLRFTLNQATGGITSKLR